jgi:hypothetical protein
MTWNTKLQRLKESLREGGVTAEELAATLGITTRTLADFMKPVAQGGREPTGPVQRLIDLLLAEVEAPDAREPKLTLVIIHEDFQLSGNIDPVDAITAMHSIGGRNNEFHFISLTSNEKRTKWAMEGLSRRRVQPHFFVAEGELNSAEARDCYFSATSVWLATQALNRDLAHITLAADPKRFWPLARELKELAEVDVTIVLDPQTAEDARLTELLREIGLGVADPVGRKFGRISNLKHDPTGKVSFGFVQPGRRAGADFKPEGAPLFFSWNHMRRDRSGKPELEIAELHPGDEVSFTLGMNHRGLCAVDVALINRSAEPLPEPSRAASETAKSPQFAELRELLKDAVAVCANKEGWALLSDVGSRLKILHPDFVTRIQTLGFQRIANFAEADAENFQYAAKGGEGTGFSAACVKLKGTAT